MSQPIQVKAFLQSETGEDVACHTLEVDRENLTLVSNLKMEAFRQKLCLEAFPSLRGKSFSLCWADDAGGYREMESDEELDQAFDSYSDDALKMYIKATEIGAEAAGVLHDNVLCNNCHGPIHGRRYVCLQCPDYDLCEHCRLQNIHREHAFACFFYPLPSVSTICHPGVKCDVCGSRPVRGARYKCIDCPNFDLCERCKNQGHHAHHEFCCIALELPKEQQICHPGFTCGSCEEAICGIRFECQQCIDYNLCQPCRTRGNHREHQFNCFPFPPVDGESEFNILVC